MATKPARRFYILMGDPIDRDDLRYVGPLTRREAEARSAIIYERHDLTKPTPGDRATANLMMRDFVKRERIDFHGRAGLHRCYNWIVSVTAKIKNAVKRQRLKEALYQCMRRRIPKRRDPMTEQWHG